MSVRRHFIDWQHPCIPAAAAWIIDQAINAKIHAPAIATSVRSEHDSSSKPRRGAVRTPPSQISDRESQISNLTSLLDLRHLLCIVPTQRAGRLLLAELLKQSAARKLALVPPEILTPGPMVDRLLNLHTATATETESMCAWMKALRRIDRDSIRALLPNPPEPTDMLAWYEIASIVASLHAELAGQQLTFARVAEAAEHMGMFAEAERWHVLKLAYRHYIRMLKRARLVDHHRARRMALIKQQALNRRNDGTSAADAPHIILIATPELTGFQRAVVAAFADRVTAIIHAPQSMHESFDDLGCVLPSAWCERSIQIDDDQIRIADRPADQAQQVLRAIASLNGKYSAEQITIGLGDASLSPVVERNARWAGVQVHSTTGRALRHTAPYRLLAAAADWLADRRFANFAALLRHPDIESWLMRHLNARPGGCATARADNDDGFESNAHSAVNPTADWLMLLDQYFSDHLHERLSGHWLGDRARRQRLAAVYRAIHQLLAPLLVSSGPADANRAKHQSVRQPLGAWCQPIINVLTSVYVSPDASAHDAKAATNAADESSDVAGAAALEACAMLCDVLAEFAAIPQALQPRVNAAGALRLLLARAGREAVPRNLNAGEIEMLGWLELHLDLAPALVIASFNDGCIPQASGSGDAFLPDALRVKLGLPNNAARYARDAYLLQAIQHSRQHLSLVVGRRGQDGDPLTPSRLLLACDADTLVRRIRAMCDDQTDAGRLPRLGMPRAGEKSRFKVPDLPADLTQPQVMRVTEFRQYLQCPFRYALSRLLKLESLGDAAVEMDPLAFGTLAHAVLQAFGSNRELADCDDANDIQDFLIAALARQAARQFGKYPMPAVRVQLARMEQRLRSFAKFQAQRRAEGWRIRCCEHQFKGDVALDIPGQEPMPLYGTIDRIDFNENTGQWQILDYKTSESGESPHKTHHGRERLNGDELQWQDLQLPLYHYLAMRSTLGIDGEVALGYICLPQQSDGTRLKLAEWTPEHLEHAIDCARDIVRNIRAGAFEISEEFQGPYDPFARICHTFAFAEVKGSGLHEPSHGSDE